MNKSKVAHIEMLKKQIERVKNNIEWAEAEGDYNKAEEEVAHLRQLEEYVEDAERRLAQ